MEVKKKTPRDPAGVHQVHGYRRNVKRQKVEEEAIQCIALTYIGVDDQAGDTGSTSARDGQVGTR
jgi:hypothetical protein